MKVRLFVTMTATVLATWLGVTFFREVPQENYPQLGRGSLPVSAKTEPKEQESLLSLEDESDEPMAAVE